MLFQPTPKAFFLRQFRLSFDQFRQDALRTDAVLYNLEIIGEAAKHLPDELKGRYPNTEWRKITALRDILAHEYFGISMEIVWDIVQNKIPALRSEIKRLIEEAK
ncbi:MAG: DUF86 domain-containing protein [Anaerolineales bacterium]|nr:DUF86 domain-containing protein [Anaerolineales bacterium]